LQALFRLEWKDGSIKGYNAPMTHKEKALDYFGRKFHCSQAVLAAFAPECGLTEEQALKLGACFGSGMRKGEVCGACTGALMVLGALYGQYDKSDPESRIRANEVNEKMMERFAKVNGSYICNDLLKCDISTSEGRQYALDNNLFTEFCPLMVANAVDVLEQIIKETEEAR
jgi:C_GCAxxG_C_C family probable redox protein